MSARQRMIAQYELAGLHQGLVVGTDHSAGEHYRVYTKFGMVRDSAPLFGLSKRQVRALAQHLGALDALVTKAPTADL